MADKKTLSTNNKRLLLKLKRYECNLTFSMICRDANVYPKFVDFKNFKNKPYKVKNRYYHCILLDEISIKNRSIQKLMEQLYEAESALYGSTTWLKRLCITYTLSNAANKETRKLKTSFEKIFSKILEDANE